MASRSSLKHVKVKESTGEPNIMAIFSNYTDAEEAYTYPILEFKNFKPRLKDIITGSIKFNSIEYIQMQTTGLHKSAIVIFTHQFDYDIAINNWLVTIEGILNTWLQTAMLNLQTIFAQDMGHIPETDSSHIERKHTTTTETSIVSHQISQLEKRISILEEDTVHRHMDEMEEDIESILDFTISTTEQLIETKDIKTTQSQINEKLNKMEETMA
ncbi:2373_t:CDS:2, partial [Acaulospora morrowiae]